MKYIGLMFFCVALTGCLNLPGRIFPPDVTGDLEPVNKSQVIDYGN